MIKFVVEIIVHGRIASQNNYVFQMVKKCDFDLRHVGFLGENMDYYFYTVSDKEIHLSEINQEFTKVEPISKYLFPGNFGSLSQNPFTRELFIACDEHQVVALNILTGQTYILLMEESPFFTTGWITPNTFITYNQVGQIQFLDLESQKVIGTQNNIGIFPLRFIVPHHSEPSFLAISDNKIEVIDMRSGSSFTSFNTDDKISAVSWLPQQNAEILIGHDDGTLNFYNIISVISFTTNKSGITLIASDTDILFANIKIMGRRQYYCCHHTQRTHSNSN